MRAGHLPAASCGRLRSAGRQVAGGEPAGCEAAGCNVPRNATRGMPRHGQTESTNTKHITIMADFIYQEPFPVGEDKTQYRLLTKDYVKVVECDGRKILKVDPKGLELLVEGRVCRRVVLPARRAPAETAQHPRRSRSHRQRQVRGLHHAAEPGRLRPKANCPPARTPARPSASATRARTSIRAPTTPRCIARGVYETYKDRNLRYSQVVPFHDDRREEFGHEPSRRRSTSTAASPAWSTSSSSSPRAAVRPTRPSSTSRPRRC